MTVTPRNRFPSGNLLPLPIILAAAVAMSASGRAWSGDSTGLLDDTLSVSLGTFIIGTDTQVRLNGTGGQPGTDVDLGRDLGFKDTNRFRVDATWRFFKRHKLRVMYFSTDTHADKNITRDLTIGDTTYPASANLHSSNSTTIAEAAYEYSFWRGDNYEISGSAGVHTVKFKLTRQWQAPSTARRGNSAPRLPRRPHRCRSSAYGDCGNSSSDSGTSMGKRSTLPARFITLTGHISDLRAGVTRTFGSHFGVGLGWNQFVTKVNITKDSFKGSLRWRYSGARST